MRFLDVKTDFAFKKVFGSEQSKPILIDFLIQPNTQISRYHKAKMPIECVDRCIMLNGVLSNNKIGNADAA